MAFRYHPHPPAEALLEKFPIKLFREDNRYAGCTCGRCIDYARPDRNKAVQLQLMEGWTVAAINTDGTTFIGVVVVRKELYQPDEPDEIEVMTFKGDTILDVICQMMDVEACEDFVDTVFRERFLARKVMSRLRALVRNRQALKLLAVNV